MISVRKLSDHDLSDLLGSKDAATICNNTVAFRGEDGSISVALHGHTIFTEKPNGDLILNTCGWNTVTTRQRLNALALPRFNVGMRKGQLHLRDRRTDQEHKFDRTITVNRWSGDVLHVG